MAVMVPSSGIVTDDSASSSNRNASNSSSDAVDLVDQQHDRPRALVFDGLQQWTGDEVLRREQVVAVERLARCFGGADSQQLARVVPLVQRLGGVDALVALQPHQGRVERRSQSLGRLGLADAGLAFEQQWLREARRAEQRCREALVGQVVDVVELAAQLVDCVEVDAHDR